MEAFRTLARPVDVPDKPTEKIVMERAYGYYDPLWRQAEKLGVPVCFHPAANPNTDQAVHRFRGHNNEAVLINAFRNPVELMLAIGSFCAGGCTRAVSTSTRGLSGGKLQLAAVAPL